jgi:hypothetical protein
MSRPEQLGSQQLVVRLLKNVGLRVAGVGVFAAPSAFSNILHCERKSLI